MSLSSLLTCRSFKTSAIERMRFAVKSLWPRAQVSDEHSSPADAVLLGETIRLVRVGSVVAFE